MTIREKVNVIEGIQSKLAKRLRLLDKTKEEEVRDYLKNEIEDDRNILSDFKQSLADDVVFYVVNDESVDDNLDDDPEEDPCLDCPCRDCEDFDGCEDEEKACTHCHFH